MTLALCIGGFSDHVSKAFDAISTAWSKSFFVPSETSLSCDPVAGLKTFPLLLDEPGKILPFT